MKTSFSLSIPKLREDLTGPGGNLGPAQGDQGSL